MQFLTFVPHGEQNSCGERFSFLEDNEKFVFSRLANFSNVSPFLVGATNTFSELIHPLIKLPNCGLKFYNLSEPLGSSSILPLRGAGTRFVGVLPLPLIFDPPHYILISQSSNTKNCFRITGYSVKVRSQVQTITCAILPRNQLPSVSNSQRGWSCKQIFDS